MADRQKTVQSSNRSRIGLYFLIALFFLPLAFALDSYSMNWHIPGDIVGRKLWFNYTMADWGDLMPEYVCFGLGNNSMCLTSNVSNMDLFGYNVTNVSTINVTNQICLGDNCILSWSDIEGTNYDQSLNTTDDVEFNSIELNGTLVSDWSEVNQSSGIWTNESNTATFLGDFNVTKEGEISTYTENGIFHVVKYVT